MPPVRLNGTDYPPTASYTPDYRLLYRLVYRLLYPRLPPPLPPPTPPYYRLLHPPTTASYTPLLPPPTPPYYRLLHPPTTASYTTTQLPMPNGSFLEGTTTASQALYNECNSGPLFEPSKYSTYQITTSLHLPTLPTIHPTPT